MSDPSKEWPNLSDMTSRLDLLRGDERNFRILADILLDRCGINLIPSPKNMSLMAARLTRIIERHALSGYAEYVQLLQENRPTVIQEFVSAMTTNTTEFFREAKHFELLSAGIRRYLSERPAGGGQELRIWCAAASTGQEVYSILMTLLEAQVGLSEWNFKVLATDIDTNVLDRASNGRYTAAEMTGVPPIFKQKYFKQVNGNTETYFLVSPKLRNFVTFAPFNLMNTQYPFKHGFDIVFCRNVLIYFDRDTATEVTEKIGSVIKPSGWLFLGHSEVGVVSTETFASEASAFYRKIKV